MARLICFFIWLSKKSQNCKNFANLNQYRGQILHQLLSEEELSTYIAENKSLINNRVIVPRIRSNESYWPPSDRAIGRISTLVQKGEEVTFDKVEGINIMKVWRTFTSEYSADAISGSMPEKHNYFDRKKQLVYQNVYHFVYQTLL